MRRAVILTAWVVLAASCAGSPIEAESIVSGTSSDAVTTASSTDTIPTTSSSSTTSASTDEGTTTPASTSSSDATTEGSSSTGALESSSSTTEAVDACHLLLDEVFNDPEMGDDGLEWIEIYNPCDTAISLDGYAVAWGGETYAEGLDLEGMIDAGGCFVVGGPMSTPMNAMPVFDQMANFMPDLQNTTNGAADGVALFDLPVADLQVDSIPIDALIYGDRNSSGLLDETGDVGVVDAPAGSAGQGYARIDPAVAPGGDAWELTATPSPGACPNPPSL